ncbi:MAG TPA: hypothetical protein VEU11_12345 [Terriglobales bacterium]|nr:hypothetical protein [Terriglobales bacterium]
MRNPLAGFGLCLFLPSLAVCGQVTGTCERTFEVNFQPRGELRMRLRSGDIDVIGVDASILRVSCELDKEPGRAKDVTITFKPDGTSGELRISGGPTSDTRFRIEIPKTSNLYVRSPAGDLSVSGVVGDKDVEIHAGDLTIAVGSAADYKHADASVYAGDLTATPFGVNKDGLFRSFDKDNAGGKYRLHAHVGAGDLVLK